MHTHTHTRMYIYSKCVLSEPSSSQISVSLRLCVTEWDQGSSGLNSKSGADCAEPQRVPWVRVGLPDLRSPLLPVTLFFLSDSL